MKLDVVFLFVLHFSNCCYSANILILQEIPSLSHHFWFKTVTSVLAANGHNITIVSGCEDTSDADNIHYIYMNKVHEVFYAVEEDDDEFCFFELGFLDLILQIQEVYKFYIKVCGGFLNSSGWEELSSYPNDFKFDLIIHDYVSGGCLLNLMQIFNDVPLISMTAFNDKIVLQSIGKSSVVPALNPFYFLTTFPTTFFDRITNVLMHLADKFFYSFYLCPKLTSLMPNSNKFNSTVSVCELSRRSILFLTNHNPAVDGPQQLPSNVIGVGGLQITDPKPLPIDLQNIAENSVYGLILFSLGTVVQSETLGDNIISDIIEFFRYFPKYTFLWKTDLETFPAQIPQNVYVRKWLPQNGILAHNNTKIFITHGGLLSTQEAIWYGVPMLGIPVYGDQFANIQRSVDKGIAEVLYLEDLTKENLCEKLNSILHNPKFRENIQLTSRAFKDQKESPLERAIWWIEWALRNPNATHLKGNGENFNFLQIESIDVFASLTIIFSTICSSFVWLIYKFMRYIFCKRPVKISSILPNTIRETKKRK